MSSDLAERIARLSPEQRALLEKRLLAAQPQPTVPQISRHDPNAPAPLSSPQARLWLIQQLDPSLYLFNMPSVWHLRGLLNVPALEKSLDTIVARHEPMHTGMLVQDGQPVQVVHPFSHVEIARRDLSALSPDLRDAEIKRLVTEMTRRPFDLARDLLFRATLLQITPLEHYLVMVRSHIANDAWSVTIFNREINACYNAFVNGETPALPPLPARYIDFADWQNERMQGAWYESEMDYWRAQLRHVPNLELVTDRPRPARLTYHGQQLDVPFDAELNASLHQASRAQGVTLYMFMLAAFQALLARYAGQDTFAVGTNILGRDRVEFENLIGYFANVLALRADLSGNPTFRELLERTRQTVVEGFAHREIPFEKIIWDLSRTRDESRTPIFQVLFQVTQVALRDIHLASLQVTPLFFDPATSEYDVSLDVRDFPDGMSCAFRYSTDLFDRVTMKQFSKHYEQLLREVLKNPDARLSSLSLLNEAEREQILVTWNDTAADFPRDLCIHELVSERAAQTPDATAVVFQSQALTYRELDQRANQLAHVLQQRSVGPDKPVGVLLERSVEMLVTILAVLKAGGAYLPLDPAAPTLRNRAILEQAETTLLVTTASLAETLAPLATPMLLLDRERTHIEQASSDPVNSRATSSDLAYVIYTSGTTGQPKGVMVEHRSLVNHSNFFQRYYGLTAQDRVLQFAPIAFDFSAEEIFPAWLAGAAIVIRPEGAALAPREFLEFVAAQQLTMLDLPTAFWHSLVQGMDELDLSLPPSVRLVIVGGEQVSTSMFARWRARVGNGVRWVNTYGPTEATIAVTTFEPDETWSNDRDLPIGRPISNAQVYILDEHMDPVPVGVPGDLYIGGEPVARGYLNRAELTAEKFVPNPFATLSPHAPRLYKTGDRARYRADGQLEFRGRRDDQVKLRGFRIELSEIETALAQHPAVKQNVVIAHTQGSNTMRLVAYIVFRDAPLAANQVRAWLGARLPDYMIPALFVTLDALPLLANGKVDRRALPSPDAVLTPTVEYVAPQTPMQQLAASIWADILRLPRVGVYDDFFMLGGHSLLATLVVARAEAMLSKNIPLRSLFDNPVLEQWARELETLAEAPPNTASPIVRVDREQFRRAAVTPTG